jgi:hypothetical protein
MPSEPNSSSLTTSDDLDQALATAERLLSRAESSFERCRLARVSEVGVVLTGCFLLSGWLGLARSAGATRVTAVAIVGIGIAVIFALAIYAVVDVPLRKRAHRELKAAVDTVALVGELIPLISRYEGWNELQMQTFRTRMSRFPIGSGGVR